MQTYNSKSTKSNTTCFKITKLQATAHDTTRRNKLTTTSEKAITDKLTLSADDVHGFVEMQVLPSGHAEHGPPTTEYGRP